MDVETGIFERLATDSALTALVGTRIYPSGDQPDDTTLPYVSYFRVVVRRLHTLAGPIDLINPRIQIDCWGSTYAESKAVAAAVRIRLDGFKGLITTISPQIRFNGVSLLTDQDLSEPGTRQFRVSQDYSVWTEE